MHWKLMVSDLLLILSWIGWAEQYTDDVNSSSVFFKTSVRNLKFCKEAAKLGRKIIFILTFLFQVICVTISVLIWTKWCPKKLLHWPFSYSDFVYIFGRASTSDGVQFSVFKPLYCTPSDVLALQNM